MLYDTKIHIPSLMEKFLEYFQQGDTVKMEAVKILVLKTLSDEKTLQRTKIIEEEYKKNKDEYVKEFENIENKRNDLITKMGKNEGDY